MADYTETFANARIAAAVALNHTEAAEAKTAGDLIAAANTVWTNTIAGLAKAYDDAMAVAAHTETDLLAAANSAKDIADSTARLTYTNTVAPLAVTLAEALSGFGVTRVTAIATAGETRSKATADANATFVGAMASPGIAYATAMAEAGKTYAIDMAGIGKDESVASATLEKARLASLDPSDPTFDYYGGGSGYSGGGYSSWYDTASYFFSSTGYYWTQNVDNFQLYLDVAGLIPVLGEPLDLLNAAISLGRGNYGDASLSLISVIPVVGDAIGKGGKFLTKLDDAGNCAHWFSRLWNGGCFVPGTLVTLSDMPQGPELQAALWSSDSFLENFANSRFESGGIALLDAPARRATTFKIPIEDVPLGARVPTKNPRPWEYDDSFPDPDEATWAKISITAERLDGQIIDAELIRPIAWINAHQLCQGASFSMRIEELQLDGTVHVTAMEVCPPIATGDGSVVTARFVTREVDEIATITIVGPDGTIETLSGTKIHPVWSVDRQDWVPLGELYTGELLQAAAGNAIVTSVTIARCTTPVYNIEVHGVHV